MSELENKTVEQEVAVTSATGEAAVAPEPVKKKHKREKKPPIWGPFIKFYTRFKIPWWLFIISTVGQIAYTEFNIQVAQYTININKGELYNINILLYAAITLGMSILGILVNMSSNYGNGILTLRARRKIWGKILYLPATELDKEQPSSFVSRITMDIPMASSTITSLGLFISSLYGFIRAFIVLFQYNWNITLWLLIVVPFGIADFWFIGKIEYWSYKRVYGAINKMMTFFSEHLASMKHIKAQCTEEQELALGYEVIEKRFKADCFKAIMTSLSVTVHYVYSRIAFFILVLRGKNMVESGKLERTALVTANTYMSNVQMYESEILMQYETIKGNQAVLGRVAELSITPTEKDCLKRLAPLPENQKDIVLKNVSFGYTKDVEVLHDITVTIPKGKRTAIVGNNGCGKSTLFKLLMRFYNPTSGEILYGDDRADDIHLDDWRKKFGYVLQNSPLFMGTIRDNIVYGLDREVSEEEIIAAAKVANAYDFIMEFPEGFDKNVGEGGSYLSGGQRQRIAIARAVITNPSVILMDEATASLDHVSDMLVWEAMNKVMEGRTTLLIAHDMSAVLTADNVIVLNSGRLEATGTHDQLIKTSPTYREYVELQQKAEVK